MVSSASIESESESESGTEYKSEIDSEYIPVHLEPEIETDDDEVVNAEVDDILNNPSNQVLSLLLLKKPNLDISISGGKGT